MNLAIKELILALLAPMPCDDRERYLCGYQPQEHEATG